MEKMKAIIVSNNKDLLWAEAQKPKILDHEVLIKIKATAVNRADVVQKNGFYPPPPGASEILGLECSGVIEAIGKNVKKRKVGEKVCALLAGGGYAQYMRHARNNKQFLLLKEYHLPKQRLCQRFMPPVG